MHRPVPSSTADAVAILLLQASRRPGCIPYPDQVPACRCAVAALPWTADLSIDPRLASVLFIAPAIILDSAYDFRYALFEGTGFRC